MRCRLIGTAVVLLAAGCAPAGPSQAGPPPPGPPQAGPPQAGPSQAGPSQAGPSPVQPARCPADGARIEIGTQDAAMGLRVLGFFLVNCGTTAYRVEGFPELRLLDEDHEPQDVRVLHDVREITISVPALEGEPRPVVLQPGERASAGVVWRNTYDDITHPPVTAALLDMAPQPGRPARTVVPPSPLDLGSTGRIGVSPWVFVPEPAQVPIPGQEPPPASEDPAILAM
ncbi:DUF4232 domain-containing protein [Actinoplanes sp. RD1]|uniref:DUF4232 domain-containing protein n=1 Tax=Actinoplanes sp. RD1 TaxID=3064538 RepID=UPI002741C2A1|nr:DUF4232 domain-containing protein [Actinoplanes sp. RD1]